MSAIAQRQESIGFVTGFRILGYLILLLILLNLIFGLRSSKPVKFDDRINLRLYKLIETLDETKQENFKLKKLFRSILR